jgi:hypothetical protein
MLVLTIHIASPKQQYKNKEWYEEGFLQYHKATPLRLIHHLWQAFTFIFHFAEKPATTVISIFQQRLTNQTKWLMP